MASARTKDPFDVPSHIIPKGMTYQWVAKTIMGEPHPSYKSMIEAGWIAVPAHRHPTEFRSFDEQGNVCIGGQVLMGRMNEVSNEALLIDQDKAHRNAGASARLVKYGDVPITLNAHEMAEATRIGVSCEQWALRRMKMIAEGRERDMALVCDWPIDDIAMPQALRFEKIKTRQPKHSCLRWLFNLISTEQ